MDEQITALRKYYFSFLYFSIIYFAVAILVVGKRGIIEEPELGQKFLLILTGLIPTFLFLYRFRFKKKFFYLSTYIKLLAIGELPIIIGFIMTLFSFNYYFILISFLIYILSYLVLLPVKKLN